jgi:hypothetical protein
VCCAELDIDYILQNTIDSAALAHLGERQTEVHFMSRIQLHSGGTVFDPQKRHSFLFCCVAPPSIWLSVGSISFAPNMHLSGLEAICSSIVSSNEHVVSAFRLDSSKLYPRSFRLVGRTGASPLTVKSKQTLTFQTTSLSANPILHHPSNNTVDALTIAVLSPHTYSLLFTQPTFCDCAPHRHTTHLRQVHIQQHTNADTMARMTRAKAAEVAERLHVDEDAVLDLSLSDINSATPEAAEREVLGNIAPNSAERKAPAELSPRKTRGKRKGRAAAETEPEPVVETEIEAEQEQDGEVKVYVDPEVESQEEQDEEMNTENEAADEALEATTNETMECLAKLRITSLASRAPAAPEEEQDASIAEATETTADASENTELEQATTSTAASPAKEAASALPNISIAIPPQQQQLEGSELDNEATLEAPSSPLATAMPKVIKSLRTETPGKRSTSNKENVQPIEPIETATSASTLDSPDMQPSSPSQQTSFEDAVTQPAASPSESSHTEEPIEAVVPMAESVDKTSAEVPEAPASPGKTQTPKPTAEVEKPKKAKAAPVVRLTKAAAARLSMAQGPNKDASKAPTSSHPRPSIMPARAGNVRQSVVPAASSKRIPPSTSTAKAPATKTAPKPKTETTIPHSKPRPVSLSFPTPPPAAKSTKAPTKSTFQLPGEAVAAKLKAAREERAKREATAASSKDEKKPAFKARPVPSSLSKTPSVRHTAASRARDPAKAGEVAAKPTTSTSTSTATTVHKRSNTISTSKPRPSTAVPSSSTTKPSAPSTLTVQKRPRPSSMHVSSTTASAATGLNAPRNPSVSSTSGATASHPGTGGRITSGASSKGKEVYARFGAARDAAENEKREKEEAARKARAAAAEKGRAASREWAEKQRVKKMVAQVEGRVGA